MNYESMNNDYEYESMPNDILKGSLLLKCTFEEGEKKRKKKDANKFLNLFSVILRTAKGKNYS